LKALARSKLAFCHGTRFRELATTVDTHDENHSRGETDSGQKKQVLALDDSHGGDGMVAKKGD